MMRGLQLLCVPVLALGCVLVGCSDVDADLSLQSPPEVRLGLSDPGLVGAVSSFLVLGVLLLCCWDSRRCRVMRWVLPALFHDTGLTTPVRVLCR